MVDTGAVSDDDRGTVVSLSLTDCLEGLGLVGAHRYLCGVNVAVGGGDQTEVFLADALAGRGELGDGANGGSLRCLAAGVGVNLGVEDKDVDILAGSEDVVETAETDVVGSAVTGDDPLAALHDEALQGHDAFAYVTLAGGTEGNDGLVDLAGGHSVVAVVEPLLGLGLDFSRAAVAGQGLLHEGGQTHLHLLVGDGHTETKLSEVLKEGVCPSRTMAAEVGGVGG